MKRLTILLKQRSGIIFNIIFIFYAWLYELLLKNVIADYSATIFFKLDMQKTNITVGFILFFAFIAETVAIFMKSRYIHSVLSSSEGGLYKTPLAGYFAPIIMLNIFHLIGAGFVCVLMLYGFGIAWDSAIGMIVLLILFVRALFLGYLTLLAPSDRNYSGKDITYFKRLLSNLLLTVWGCIGYTVVWENFGNLFKGYFMRPDIFSTPLSIIQFIIFLIGVLIICFLLFIPIRMGFYVEEMILLKNNTEKRILNISLMLAVISAIFPFLGIF